jgi:YrbI family 3-deoxy-D-manno-octulosonate 8-phosphate phosphatase
VGSKKINKVKIPNLLVFDFDGVFTDNKVIVREDGLESVVCSREDGLGIEMARKSGLKMLILSKEKNKVVSARAKKLQIEVIQGIEDKPSELRKYAAKNKIELKDIFYVGNDLNDLSVMRIVGTSACPADSHPSVKKIATIKLRKNGGNGAIRELIEQKMGINLYRN